MLQLTHSYELENPSLHVVHAIVRLVQGLFGQVDIEIIISRYPIWQARKILQVSPAHLYLAMMLIHIQEPIKFLIYDFHDMLRHRLPLQVLQELFRLLLLLILLISKVLLEALIDLLEFLLSLGLVSSEIVLLFQFVPDFKLVHEVSEQTVDFLESVGQVCLLVNILDLVASDVHQEFIGVNILGHS